MSFYERLRDRLDLDEQCLARALYYAKEADGWRALANAALHSGTARKHAQEADWSERKAEQALTDYRKAMERRMKG